MTELAGGELCLPQRPHNNVGTARRRGRRRRPKQRWIDCVKSDTRAIGAAEEDVDDRTGWRRILSAAATTWEQLEEEEEEEEEEDQSRDG